MSPVARVLGLSLLAGVLTAVITLAFLGRYEEYAVVCLFLGCVGAVVGAVAGAAGEVVAALRRRPPD